MTWTIWEFLDGRGLGILEIWLLKKKIQKKARATLNQRIDWLRRFGPEAPNLLAGPIYKHIYKLRVKAQGIQLRPMLCKGPIDNEREFTLLLGAIEKGNKLQPRDAPERAEVNREEILRDPLRRHVHERFSEQN